ncbi:MAG: hypothetical protein AAFU85_04720 [Planctomycetota bacterium]
MLYRIANRWVTRMSARSFQLRGEGAIDATRVGKLDEVGTKRGIVGKDIARSDALRSDTTVGDDSIRDHALVTPAGEPIA